MSSVVMEPREQRFTLHNVEKLSIFFSNTFARNVAAFQYLCHELQPEIIETRMLPIQTPLQPIDTTLAVSFNDHLLAADVPPTM